ncbi:hypothetical protein JXA47_02215 [Candidatus Sumerlaeota bacterium]|nr:hypothetical protein [Candidatus Sumerlaeota bacterium]
MEQPRSAGANWQARVEGSYENETIANVLDDMARQLGDFAWVAQSIDNRAAVSLFPRGSDETYLSQVLPSLASDEATIEEIFVSLGSEGRLELANGYFSGFGLTPSPTGFGVNERGEIQFVTNEVNEEMRQLRMDLSDLEGLTLREVLLKALLREAPSGVVYECRWWTDRQAIHFRRIMRGRNPIAPLSQGHRTAEQAEMEYLRAHPHPPTLEELHRRNEQGMSVLLMGSLTSQEVIDRFHGGVVPPGLEEIFSYPGARFIPMAGAVSVGPSPEDPQP